MNTDQHTWWYLSRASGIIAWLVIAATCLWGILLITRMLKPADRPAWLLDLHKHLGLLSILATLGHVLFLLKDDWMQPTLAELLVIGKFDGDRPNPMQADMPLAIDIGLVALYLLVVIQLTSYAMKKLPKRLWRAVHLTSYGVLLLGTIHGLMVGTDTSNMVLLMCMAGIIGVVLFALIARILQGRAKRIQREQSNALRGA
jgi:predicted ferric reductase